MVKSERSSHVLIEDTVFLEWKTGLRTNLVAHASMTCHECKAQGGTALRSENCCRLKRKSAP
jgi:hypothetical protein